MKTRSLSEIRARKDAGLLNDRKVGTAPPPDLPEDFWAAADKVEPQGKVPISIRLDAEVLDWFKAQGRGYQTRINDALREYMTNRQG